MNSTDENQLRDFFGKRLVPAARQLRARQIKFFALGPDDPQPNHEHPAEQLADAGSFYVAPPSGPQLFSREGADLAKNLQTLWGEQDLPELVALAEPLVKLAKQLEPQEQHAEDISPFVYVLY